MQRLSETQRTLLEALEAGAVRGPEMAAKLDVSRTAIWNAIEALRDAGFDIESTNEGYVLRSTPEYGAGAIEYGLTAPYTIEYHDVLESSNDRARELATEGAKDVVVVADEQTAPRGRLSREWSSPPGGIWLSIVLRPESAPSKAPLFTLATAVAITGAAREAGVDAGIKWPNDVLVAEAGGDSASGVEDDRGDDSGPAAEDRGGDKLAGVLTEMEGEADRVSWLIIGVGFNANVDIAALPQGATSLRACRDEDVERRLVVQRLLETFHDLRRSPESIVPAWREYALTPGQRVRVDTPSGVVEGEAVDVNDLGALIVRTDEGTVTVDAGDCEHLRPT
jgi:BirA family biotin operon repressor/biotin-[acetyl-CoA-carboxylase] ligase